MNNDLLQLLKVQEVDGELRSLEEAKSQYPEEISQRKSEIDQAERNLKELTDRIEELEKEQRKLEGQLELAKEDLKKHEERFAEVTTNKEYDALQVEIEACKGRMSETETQILEIIESSDSTREQIELEKRDLDEIREAQQSIIDELQGKLDSIQGEVDGVNSRREKAIKGIDEKLLTVYERSRSFRGLRVAAVRKASCGVCYRQLPAQQKSNARRNDQVIHCESCGAILVWDDTSA